MGVPRYATTEITRLAKGKRGGLIGRRFIRSDHNAKLRRIAKYEAELPRLELLRFENNAVASRSYR